MLRVLLIAVLLPLPALADSLVATRNLPARALIAAEDVTLVKAEIAGALTDAASAIGREARVAIYAGRPIHPGDLGAPALVERNAKVTISYQSGGLRISTEGRALARGGAGEEIPVLNLGSKTTVRGRVQADGQILVGDQP